MRYRTTSGQILHIAHGTNQVTGVEEFQATINLHQQGVLPVVLTAASEQEINAKVDAFYAKYIIPRAEATEKAYGAKIKLIELDKKRPAVVYHVYQCLADPEIVDESFRLTAATKFAGIAEQYLEEKFGWPAPKYFVENRRGRPPSNPSEVVERALMLIRIAGYFDPAAARRRGAARFGNTWSPSLPLDDYEDALKRRNAQQAKELALIEKQAATRVVKK